MKRTLPLVLLSGLALAGCHIDMWQQPKAKSQERSDFFADGMNTRQPVAATVSFDGARADSAFYTGYTDGKLVKEFPVAVTEDVIRRGQDRFLAFCSHCHGATGDGKGMISQRGYNISRPIATYHTDRLRAMPVGHFFDVMTNGYGAMYPMAARIKTEDRWAIAAYIRALQFSQHAQVGDLDETSLRALGAEGFAKNSGNLFQVQDYKGQPAATGTVEGAGGTTTTLPSSPLLPKTNAGETPAPKPGEQTPPTTAPAGGTR
ncbi:MAG: cytochrome c [Armatimonadetes bacterium]|nr:cytochrome c [Armatimonadota bacterium]